MIQPGIQNPGQERRAARSSTRREMANLRGEAGEASEDGLGPEKKCVRRNARTHRGLKERNDLKQVKVEQADECPELVTIVPSPAPSCIPALPLRSPSLRRDGRSTTPQCSQGESIDEETTDCRACAVCNSPEEITKIRLETSILADVAVVSEGKDDIANEQVKTSPRSTSLTDDCEYRRESGRAEGQLETRSERELERLASRSTKPSSAKTTNYHAM